NNFILQLPFSQVLVNKDNHLLFAPLTSPSSSGFHPRTSRLLHNKGPFPDQVLCWIAEWGVRYLHRTAALVRAYTHERYSERQHPPQKGCARQATAIQRQCFCVRVVVRLRVS